MLELGGCSWRTQTLGQAEGPHVGLTDAMKLRNVELSFVKEFLDQENKDFKTLSLIINTNYSMKSESSPSCIHTRSSKMGWLVALTFSCMWTVLTGPRPFSRSQLQGNWNVKKKKRMKISNGDQSMHKNVIICPIFTYASIPKWVVPLDIVDCDSDYWSDDFISSVLMPFVYFQENECPLLSKKEDKAFSSSLIDMLYSAAIILSFLKYE